MEVFIFGSRVCEGERRYGKGEAVHVCLVVYCGAGLIGGNEGVVVRGKVRERTDGSMTFELILDLCRAEKSIGN